MADLLPKKHGTRIRDRLNDRLFGSPVRLAVTLATAGIVTTIIVGVVFAPSTPREIKRPKPLAAILESTTSVHPRETVSVVGTASNVEQGAKVYAVARPVVRHPQGWFVGRATPQTPNGRWTASILIAPPASAPLKVKALVVTGEVDLESTESHERGLVDVLPSLAESGPASPFVLSASPTVVAPPPGR